MGIWPRRSVHQTGQFWYFCDRFWDRKILRAHCERDRKRRVGAIDRKALPGADAEGSSPAS